MNSITYITLDLQAPNFAVMASAKQNDTLGRQIAATLRDGSASFDATGLLCEIRYAKPDGTVGFYDTLEDDETPAYSIDGNVVTFTLAEQMLTIAGAVYVDLNFYAATGEKLTAFTFVLQVEASVLDDGTIVSSDYYNVLTATLAEAAEIAANLPQPSTSTPTPDSASGSAGTGNGFARGNHSHPLNVATSGTPANLGTAANGTSGNYARQDHVHAMPSASDVGALPNTTTAADLDVKYKLFNSIADLGLSGSASVADTYAAMPASSALICPATEITNAPNSDGTVEIVKGGTDGWIRFHGRQSSVGDYRMFFSSSDVPSGTWELLCGSRSFTFTENSNLTTSNVSAKVNGRTVFLSVIGEFAATIPAGTWTTIGTVSSDARPTDYIVAMGLTAYVPIQVQIAPDGAVQVRRQGAGSGGCRFSVTWIL